METSELYEGCTEFDYDNQTMHFVRFHKKSNRIVFWEHKKDQGIHVDNCRHLPIAHFPMDVLKTLDIWDKLTTKDRESYEVKKQEEDEKVSGKMEHARKYRRNKFPNIPDELTCKTCGKVQKVVRSVVAARVEKLGILLDDYVKGYECQKCHPTKGRKKNPALAHLPSELVCKCGNKASTSPSAIVARAKKLNITPEEVIEKYVCQTCNPTKGRKKKKK